MDYVLKEENGFSYIEAGEGQTLLLLHGLMGALSNWEKLLKSLVLITGLYYLFYQFTICRC
jgi:pimeloyl-ACP methyl ester carboxylesterase